jgi:hypothetical protein
MKILTRNPRFYFASLLVFFILEPRELIWAQYSYHGGTHYDPEYQRPVYVEPCDQVEEALKNQILTDTNTFYLFFVDNDHYPYSNIFSDSELAENKISNDEKCKKEIFSNFHEEMKERVDMFQHFAVDSCSEKKKAETLAKIKSERKKEEKEKELKADCAMFASDLKDETAALGAIEAYLNRTPIPNDFFAHWQNKAQRCSCPNLSAYESAMCDMVSVASPKNFN